MGPMKDSDFPLQIDTDPRAGAAFFDFPAESESQCLDIQPLYTGLGWF
jgi:hypothetical protein